jgi:dTDP-4-dehydrorhamnose reductase
MKRHDKTHLLIIGANGFVGQHLARKAAPFFHVFKADLGSLPGDQVIPLDITSRASVDAGFRTAAPEAVALLAALSDIDQCECRPETADAVNVRGTAHVVEACAHTGAKLLFTSSAAVFDGTRHGYTEKDPPTPISIYGRTKARAEDLVASKLPSALILRLALVVGFAEGGGTNAMLNKFVEKLRAGQSVSFPDYEYRNPIDAATLSDFMLELLRRPAAGGLFHLGATESISRFDLGLRLAGKLGLDPALVQRQSAPRPGRAPRGLDHFLFTEKIRRVCQTPVPSCDQVIERAIHGSPESHL